MASDEETYPLGTIVRLRETGEFAILLKKSFMEELARVLLEVVRGAFSVE